MNISDQDIQAYVDGELAPQDVARVDAAIAADALVAARVEREKRLRARLRGAFDPVLDEPVPARLSGLLERADVGASVASPLDAGRAHERERSTWRRGRWRVPAVALAASLAAFAMVHVLRGPRDDVVVRHGDVVANGELAHRLDTALASAPEATSVAIGLTFRNAEGRVCRTFVSATSHVAGLACREGDGWSLPLVSRADAVAPEDLRRAASALPPEVQAAVDARMRGDAFDAAQERQSRDSGWR